MNVSLLSMLPDDWVKSFCWKLPAIALGHSWLRLSDDWVKSFCWKQYAIGWVEGKALPSRRLGQVVLLETLVAMQ